ncbi:hypothetical protein ROG8370_01861 [Roseovarius gaetbuli]|uniref:DUF1499 domain-containing protein n=1 Tax=Roseovarius gaetbuli TaxID=1356575 RepID=A0A1X6Z8F5_9RHOB|nr:DUF1499 domain-containing protein [Roseovarius gaetbuli]SLN43788.1 hypothetical protein ROG8370_01861 [Roseovarius gaetbuli]
MKLIFGLIVLGVIAGAGYVRLAPSDVARWHQMPEMVTDQDLANGAMRVIAADAITFERLDAIIRATPRTHVIAGAPSEGMITYVTRSAVVGFPDYTTLRRAGDQLEIYGRLRFGKSDLGVNAARIDGWLMRLGQGG